jgi:hypothetical protein
MSNETAWEYQLRFMDPITVETARPQTAILKTAMADKPALQRDVVCGDTTELDHRVEGLANDFA